jgi:Phage-related protein
LEDTYNPTIFRLAAFQGPIDFDTELLQVGRTTLEFDCKPERWLKIGETAITATTDTSITNPTEFNAKPIIRVYGTGTVQVGTGTFTINTEGSSYIDIDCDILDCYEGATNQNSKVSITK